ncbi:MAG: S41 family peptidase [Actinomycetes bacterium]
MPQRPYARFPSLSGGQLTFVAEDDVWLAPAEGGRAWRLTSDNAPVADARISPDGEQLAYLGRRDGAPEVYVVPVAGGVSRRVTWWGDPFARVLGWLPDGRIAAASAKDEPFRSRTWGRALPPEGGPAERLRYGPISALAHGPGGAVVLGNGAARRDYAWWKRYRGGTAGRLWLDRDGSGTFRRFLADLDGQVVAPMFVDGRVAFLSDHEGHGNVYSCLPDGSDLRRHTDHVDFYARQATTDGSRVAYMAGGDLWVLDDLAPDSQPRLLEVQTGGPARTTIPVPVDVPRYLGDVVPDETARASAVEVRGTVQWVTHRDGPVRAVEASPGVRTRLPRVLGRSTDTPAVVFVTDAEEDDALEVVSVHGVSDPGISLSSEGEGRRRRLAAGQLGRVLDLAAAPDGTTVAVASHDGRLLVVDVASGAVREVARTDNDAVRDLAYSPDSAWVAWTHPGPEPLSQIRLARVEDATVLEATPMRFTDTDPVFTADGLHLAFLSRRTFDPVYDTLVFDLSFPAGTRPYLLPLRASTASPFAPQVEGHPASHEPAEARKDEQASSTAEAGKQSRPPVKTVEVDAEGLEDRVVPVPVPASRYSRLQAVADGLVWLHEPVRGELGEDLAKPGAEPPRPALERIDFAHGKCVVLAEDVEDAVVSGDGRRVVARKGDKLEVLPADRPVGEDEQDPDARVDVDLGRVNVTVVPAAEWRQMYDENGRLMRDHFWVADMAGIDWDAVLDRYRPLLDRIGSRDDLSDVIWEVHGELGTSHAYEIPPERPVDRARRLGKLGADLSVDGEGRWSIERVLPGESSAGQARSPLSAPGVAARAGEALLAVGGRAVDPVRGPGPLLVGTADTPVELLLGGTDDAPRRVAVVPLADEMPLRYQNWVAGRRAAVHEATGGRVGYLHVPDMVANGWAQLHRDLHTELARDGLVVDVRDNNGGHTSELVIEKLRRRLVGWQLGRGFRPFTYPTDARRGPLVCVTDENAGSDGDIVTAVIKALGLGPVVGKRTWGGVVGIDMRYSLVDGTAVTQPRYACWFEGYGWGVENYGVDPDVDVDIAPQDWAEGTDPQLDTAVRMVVEALEEDPAATPPDTSTRPSRVPPPLPPRPGSGHGRRLGRRRGKG